MDNQQYLLNNHYNFNSAYNTNNGGLTPFSNNLNNNNQQNNAPPVEVYQYPNSSDFPQYNQTTNSNQPQIDYSKYDNLNQLNHRGISQGNDNTFYITRRCCTCVRWFPFIYITLSLSFCLSLLLDITVGTVIFSIFGLFLASLGMLMLCKSYHSVYFILNPNNIKVTLVAWCGRKSIIYESGQINQVIFNSTLTKSDKGKNFYNYEIIINQNIPGKDHELSLFDDGSKNPLYTEEEIGFFNYIVNHHIQSKLNNQNNQIIN